MSLSFSPALAAGLSAVTVLSLLPPLLSASSITAPKYAPVCGLGLVPPFSVSMMAKISPFVLRL